MHICMCALTHMGMAAGQEKGGQKVQSMQPGAVSKAGGDQLHEALGASLSDLTQDQEVSPPWFTWRGIVVHFNPYPMILSRDKV